MRLERRAVRGALLRRAAGDAGWVPPPSPALNAAQVAELYRANNSSIRPGVLCCFLGTMFFLAFGVGIAGQTRRIRPQTGAGMPEPVALGGDDQRAGVGEVIERVGVSSGCVEGTARVVFDPDFMASNRTSVGR